MLFGEKVKNKKGLPDLTLSLPSLQRNRGDNFAQSNQSSIGRSKMNEPNILTYPSVKEVCGCSFCNENNWFHGDSSPKPGPQCFLQYQAIHTGQSLSGAFWNGLVLSAKKYLSLTSSFSETQPGYWRLTPYAHGATTHQLNHRSWPKISPFFFFLNGH